MLFRKIAAAFAVVALLSWAITVRPGPALAGGSWSYGITAADTPAVIDQATTAVVDTTAHEIRLPKLPLPNSVAFLPGEGIECAVLTTTGVKVFSFDGTQMVENTVLSVGFLSNPLALAAPPPYPDVVVATPDGIRHYSFTGSGMVENPVLAVAGLTGVISVGAKEGDVAALAGSQVRRYLFTGTGMEEAAVLEPQVAFTSPVALALAKDCDMAVLEQNRARFFQFTGTGMVENPALAVTGLTNPVAIAADGDGYDLSIVDGSQIKHFSFDGSNLVYNAALSVTSGLTAPTAVAIRPGYYDRLIVDGAQVKYYSFDGSQMVYNPALSKTVADIAQSNRYRSSAVAISLPVDPGNPVDRVRVRAYHDLLAGTSVTWSVTADGANWVRKWRVRGTATGAVAEISNDNGVTWASIGDAGQASPSVDRQELWTTVAAGRSVRWKAELATTDPTKTPVIRAVNGLAVKWEANARPNPPVLGPVPGWFYTTTPTFSWTFSDPDPGDSQSAFQVVTKKQAGGGIVYDSGKIMGVDASYTVPTSTNPATPGPLWLSGVYAFTVEVRVWDAAGMASDFSPARPFKVLAFERPRVGEIVSAPPGQTVPVLEDPGTHMVITPGMAAPELPKTRAGGKVTVLVDSVGPVEALTARFPYLATEATVGEVARQNPAGSPVNRWQIPFWTAAGLDLVPGGTVVGMHLQGTGTEGGTTEFGTVSGITDHGTLNYAAGVVRTEGSVYEDWFVVLEGRKP